MVDEGRGGCYEEDFWKEGWLVIGFWRDAMESVDRWTLSFDIAARFLVNSAALELCP